MNLFVLSELRAVDNHIGWSCVSDLEHLLVQTCGAKILYAEANNNLRFLQEYRHKVFRSWFKVNELPTLGKGPNVLLIFGMNPVALLMLPALGKLVKQFDLCLAYVFDLHQPEYLDRKVLDDVDHLFLPVAEVADDINARSLVSASFLPQAVDVLRFGSDQPHRCIDIIGYGKHGRRNAELHDRLKAYCNSPESDRVYFHSTFSKPQVDNFQEDRWLLWKLLRKSKISLCFDPSQVDRFFGYSPMTTRWFEGFAAGCTIVGKRPTGKGVAEQIDWEDSTLEIPDSPSEWIPFLEDLLNDEDRLRANARRNYRECLLRHDWRYRLKVMFETAGLPLPETLKDELTRLQLKAALQPV